MNNVIDFNAGSRKRHTARSIAKELGGTPESALQLLRESGIPKDKLSEKVSDRERVFAYEYTRNNIKKAKKSNSLNRKSVIQVTQKRKRKLTYRETDKILEELKKLVLKCIERKEIFGISDLPPRFSEISPTAVVNSLHLIQELTKHREEVDFHVPLLRAIFSNLGMTVVVDYNGHLSYKGPSKHDNITSIEAAYFAICSLPKEELDLLIRDNPEISMALRITLGQLKPPYWPPPWCK